MYFFPILICLAASREVRVRDWWSDPEGGEGWNPLFTRPFNDRGGGGGMWRRQRGCYLGWDDLN